MIWAAERRPRWSGSRQGGLSNGDAPPIFFSVLPEKKTGRTRKGYAASVSGKAANGCAIARSKRKGRLTRSGAVALRARRGSTYRCKRRFCLAFGHAILFCEVDTAVPWRMVTTASGCKDAFDLLLFYCLALRRSQYFRHQCSTGSSFRAFRFTRKGYAASVRRQSRQRLRSRYALPWRSWRLVPAGGRGRPPLRNNRWPPVPRRGRCPHRPVAEAPSTTGPAAAKREAGCIPDFPGLEVSPRAGRFRP